MLRTMLIIASVLSGAAAASAALPPTMALAETPALPHGPACGPGVRHVSLLAEAQMCPRPLATTIIAPPHRRLLHT